LDLLQNIDPAHLPLIAVGCALLCAVVVVIGFLLQALSSIFDVIAGLVEVAVEIAQGGPVAWCGCLALVVLLVGGGGVAVMLIQGLAACGTPEAINFCALIGR